MMAKSARSEGRGSIPLPVVIVIIVVVLGAVGFMGWKMFVPPPDPSAGMSVEQRQAAIQERVQKTGQKMLMDNMMGNQKPGLSGATK
jgi:hypothetical protein